MNLTNWKGREQRDEIGRLPPALTSKLIANIVSIA